MRPIASVASVIAATAVGVASWILLRDLQRQHDQATRRTMLVRMRSERELQDALLQNFQGVLLKIHAAATHVIDRPEEARSRLNAALAQADEAITQAGDAMQAGSSSAQDPSVHLLQLGAEPAAGTTDGKAQVLCIELRGEGRKLSRLAREAVRRIAREALRTASSAARAEDITVDIHYGGRHLKVQVRARP